MSQKRIHTTTFAYSSEHKSHPDLLGFNYLLVANFGFNRSSLMLKSRCASTAHKANISAAASRLSFDRLTCGAKYSKNLNGQFKANAAIVRWRCLFKK